MTREPNRCIVSPPSTLCANTPRSHRAEHALERPSRRPSLRALLALGFVTQLASGVAVAQWNAGPYLTDTNSTCPPFVFVTMNKSSAEFGTDAETHHNLAGDLDLGFPGRELWYMDRHRSDPVLLFPRTIHENTLGLPATYSLLKNGSVHEPTVFHSTVEDQYWVIFSFAIDQSSTRNLSKPCELFAINLSAAIAVPDSFDDTAADSLPIVRLTTSIPSGLNDTQMKAHIFARAFNPELAPQITYTRGVDWPTNFTGRYETNTGACVVDEEHGPVLYFASNERRTDGQGMMAADIVFNSGLISIANRREVFHFGTTSLISFFESPRGACGSYRSSTESTGQWGIFEFRSDEAQWQTVSGYGNGLNIVDHNGTTIAVGDDPADSLLAISRYYINNNESFGTIILLPYDKVGQNSDDGQAGFGQIGALTLGSQTGVRNLFTNVSEFGDSAANPTSIGKFAHPAGGRHSDSASTSELFLTYSPAGSHGTSASSYNAKLVAVTDLSAPISAVNNSYLPGPGFPVQLVLENTNLHCFAMKPILTHAERFGRKHRRMQPLLGKVNLAGLPSALADMPVAQVIAGPIYNTDVKSTKQRVGSYDPTTVDRNNSDQNTVFLRAACLTKDLTSVSLSDVWGIRIYITDAKARQLMATGFKTMFPLSNSQSGLWGYMHHDGVGDGVGSDFGRPVHYERYRHLSDVPMNTQDGTVNFYLPANVPVKFFLLHNDGTVLAAHRNHHSFAPGQLERRCTGCHDHVTGGSSLASSGNSPFDTLTQTGKWERSSGGSMQFNTYSVPSLPVPEFQTDIYPLLEQECQACHDSSQQMIMDGTNGGAGFDMDRKTVAWTEGNPPVNHSQDLDKKVAVWAWLSKSRYVNRREGAAMSPLAWHFYGVESDSEVRLDGQRNQDYTSVSGSKYWITTDVGGINPHSRLGLNGDYNVADRSKVGKVIEWIDGGAGITHNDVFPDTNPPYSLISDARRGLNGDGYQIAISAKLQSFRSSNLVVGYWDAFDNIDTVTVKVGSTTLTAYQPSGNGTHVFDMSSVSSITEATNVVVTAVDDEGNRSVIERTMRQLWLESETLRGQVSMTVNQPAFVGGQTAQFSISAPSHPNMYYIFTLSAGVHPGWDVTGLNVGLYLMQNADQWMTDSINAGLQGPLNSSGTGTFSLPIPTGLPHTELYCAAVVLSSAGPFGKSNFETIIIN